MTFRRYWKLGDEITEANAYRVTLVFQHVFDSIDDKKVAFVVIMADVACMVQTNDRSVKFIARFWVYRGIRILTGCVDASSPNAIRMADERRDLQQLIRQFLRNKYVILMLSSRLQL
jgi:hypothetical protein